MLLAVSASSLGFRPGIFLDYSQYHTLGLYHFRVHLIDGALKTPLGIQKSERAGFKRIYDGLNRRYRIDGYAYTPISVHDLSSFNVPFDTSHLSDFGYDRDEMKKTRPKVPFVLIALNDSIYLIQYPPSSKLVGCYKTHLEWEKSNTNFPLEHAQPYPGLHLTTNTLHHNGKARVHLAKTYWNVSLPETCSGGRFKCSLSQSDMEIDVQSGKAIGVEFAGAVEIPVSPTVSPPAYNTSEGVTIKFGFWTSVQMEEFEFGLPENVDELFQIPPELDCVDFTD